MLADSEERLYMQYPDFSPHTPEESDQLASKLEDLLSDFRVFQGNVRQLHWNRRFRPYLNMSSKLAMLDQVTTHNANQVAEHLIQLGYSPEAHPQTPGLIRTNVSPMIAPENLEGGLKQLIGSMEELLHTAEEVWKIARDIDEPATFGMMTQLMAQLRFAIQVFGISRLAMSN